MTTEHDTLYAEVMALRANPPARNPVKVATLFQDGNYFGADTLTPQRAEIERLHQP